MSQPRLLQDLRVGLACLYSLPPPPGSPHAVLQQLGLSQAQEFLVQLQCRNIRRKLQSLQQRQRDQQLANQGGAVEGVQQQFAGLIISGSSWLACVALLCRLPQPPSNGNNDAAAAASSSERLFAAQTLAHRVRKSKLEQAVDLEIENQDEQSLLRLSETMKLPELVDFFKEWMQHLNPLVGAVVRPYQATAAFTEERIKGELTLLTLAAISYITCSLQQQQQQSTTAADDYTDPILNTLGSAMAATALRLRYSPESIDRHGGGPIPDSQPIVAMIIHALSVVQHFAASSSSPSDHHHRFSTEAMGHCLRAFLTAIPDTLLSSPDGSSGRLSIDPRCIQAAGTELRANGISLMWDALQQHEQAATGGGGHHLGSNPSDALIVYERWAKFLPLPLEFVRHTIPIASRCLADASEDVRKAALAYLIAIYEGGSWTYQQVLSISLGLTSEMQNNQANKKRQSSKSKKRHKELLENNSTESLTAQAHAEVHHRGEVACQATVIAWEGLRLNLTAAAVSSGEHQQGQGDGPIGCLAACANACLPHLLRNPSQQSIEFFATISETFQDLCKSPSRYVRSFSFEPIHALHSCMLQLIRDRGSIDSTYQEAVVEHFFKCSIYLATSCGYPSDYFNHLGARSDEDVENERNDVRDILRTVSCSGEGGSTSETGSSNPPLDISLQILSRLLKSCADAIISAQERKEIFPETAMHTLSSLAKPLNQLAKSRALLHGQDVAVDILTLSVKTLTAGVQILIGSYEAVPMVIVLPVARIANIAMASLAPMISALSTDQQFHEEVVNFLKLAVQASALSIVHIPELTAPSILDQSIHDIRGTMRGPGGEDHVGILTLMRLTYESEDLARIIVGSTEGISQQLCELHGRLKSIETARGRGVLHGEGVTPQSRRILLGLICHMEIVTKGRAGCTSILSNLFDSSIAAINNLCSSSAIDEEFMYRMCENAFDLASFSPVMVASLFATGDAVSGDAKKECITALANAGIYGYQQLSTTTEPSGVEFQWTRLRAGLFTLLRESASPDLLDVAVELVVTMNRTECEAVHRQCLAGPRSSSSIFNDEVVSPETVPTGLFIRIVCEIMNKCRTSRPGNSAGAPRRLSSLETTHSLPNCMQSLHQSMAFVLQTIVLPCPDPDDAFVDPRPTLCEAWLNTMTELIKSIQGKQVVVADEALVTDLLTDSCVSALVLLFYPSTGKTKDERTQDVGMSLDGPHGLALIDFLTSYFSFGTQILPLAVQKLVQTIKVSFEGVEPQQQKWGAAVGGGDPAYAYGVSIIGAALFRAVQGSLPPWAVETIPAVYAALFSALKNDADAFGLMLEMAMEVRLDRANGCRFGSVEPGQLLSGFSEHLSSKAKVLFLKQSTDMCKQNNVGGWRRFKVLIKHLCGGKKKDTDFKQKPAPTRWVFERI